MNEKVLLRRIDLFSVIAVFAYLAFLAIRSVDEITFEYMHYIDNSFKIAFSGEILLRMAIQQKRYFFDWINWADTLLLLISFHPDYEIFRALRVIIYFLRKPELHDMMSAIRFSRKEIEIWMLLLFTITALFSIHISSVLGEKYPELWGNAFRALFTIFTIGFESQNDLFIESVRENKFIEFIFSHYVIVITLIAGIIGTVLIASRNHIDNEKHVNMKDYEKAVKKFCTENAQEYFYTNDMQNLIKQTGPWTDWKDVAEKQIKHKINFLLPLEMISTIQIAKTGEGIIIAQTGEYIFKEMVILNLNKVDSIIFKNAFDRYIDLRFGGHYYEINNVKLLKKAGYFLNGRLFGVAIKKLS